MKPFIKGFILLSSCNIVILSDIVPNIINYKIDWYDNEKIGETLNKIQKLWNIEG